jgi:hypothetical protein
MIFKTVQRSKFNVQGPEPSRSFALPCHVPIQRRQKFPRLAIPLNHIAVSIDNRKRSFHVCFSLYRSSTTSLSRPSTRAREDCHEEFRNWIDNRYTAPIVLIDYWQ